MPTTSRAAARRLTIELCITRRARKTVGHSPWRLCSLLVRKTRCLQLGFERRLHTEFPSPATKVRQVQRGAMNADHCCNITQLAFRFAFARPFQLGEDRVLDRRDRRHHAEE